MRAGEENEEQEGRQCFEEFQELYRQLSRRQRFQVHLFIQWSAMQRRWGKVAWDWLIFQWKIDEKLNASKAGMSLPAEQGLARLRYGDVDGA
jgi:hypothetical protein